jgi:Na+/proline symporter
MAVIALAIAMGLAVFFPERQVFWVIIFGWSGIAAAFCPVIILTLFWKGYTERGAIASMISGFLCVPLFKFVLQDLDTVGKYFVALDVLAPSFAIAMAMGWVVSKFFSKKTSEGTDSSF